jgi:pyruvate formate lyase activating enzyme
MTKTRVLLNAMKSTHNQFRIAGFVPLSTVDWPDQLTAVIFTQGCPWRCGYCHNAHLIPPRGETSIEWQTVLEKIEQRKNFLDGVVISGGEPLLQRGLQNVLLEIKSLGLKTGLHTGGALPAQLQNVLPMIDWIGLDIKAMPETYAQVTHRNHSGQAAWESLQKILKSGVAYEVRVTVHPQLISTDQLTILLNELAEKHVKHIRLQSAREPFLDKHLQMCSVNEHQHIFNQYKNEFVSAQWR